MQFPKRTVALLFVAGLLLGLILVLLGQGVRLYREKRPLSVAERYREVYRSPIIVDTSILETKKTYVSDNGVAVARYPKTVYVEVNSDIEKFIDGQFELFVGDPQRGGEQHETKDTLFVTYESSTIPGYSVSFLFRLSASYSGAAHEVNKIESRSYDLAGSRMLVLDDVFADVSIALEKISQTVTTDLLSRSELAADGEWVHRGTILDAEGYKNFTLGPDSITFYFSPYQGGPYSIGIVSSEISYASIRGLLRSEFLAKVRL